MQRLKAHLLQPGALCLDQFTCFAYQACAELAHQLLFNRSRHPQGTPLGDTFSVPRGEGCCRSENLGVGVGSSRCCCCWRALERVSRPLAGCCCGLELPLLGCLSRTLLRRATWAGVRGCRGLACSTGSPALSLLGLAGPAWAGPDVPCQLASLVCWEEAAVPVGLGAQARGSPQLALLRALSRWGASWELPALADLLQAASSAARLAWLAERGASCMATCVCLCVTSSECMASSV